MRIILVLAIAVLLAGCETDQDFWRPYHDLVGDSGGEARSSAENPSPSEAHCRSVARQRTADAAANGYDLDMQDVIYRKTYEDCAAWDAQHTH